MNTVLQILKEIRPEHDFAASRDFICDGLLDSFDIVCLVAALDARFNICIQGSDILPENFASAEAIHSLLKSYAAPL
jgi:acyl carrier protein